MTIAPPAGDRDTLIAAAGRLREEVHRSIVGQENVLDEIVMSLIAGGHALLVGVPGLAKTLMVRSLADAVHLDFRRIQFTPDLVPSDITGTEILEEDSATGGRTSIWRAITFRLQRITFKRIFKTFRKGIGA